MIADWIAEVRRRGTALPVWIWMPGIVDYAKLVRISMKIGLGESARFLRHHSNWMSRLMTRQFKPDPLLRGLAPTLADPAAQSRRLSPVHVQRDREDRALAARGARSRRGLLGRWTRCAFGWSASAPWASGSPAPWARRPSGSRAATASGSAWSGSRTRATGSSTTGTGSISAPRSRRSPAGGSIAELPDVRCRPSTIEGLRATERRPARGGGGEPCGRRRARARAHARSARAPHPGGHVEQVAGRPARRGARRARAQPRCRVPRGIDRHVGHAGAQRAGRRARGGVPLALRGLLNATANFILSRMTAGATYEEALAEAQRAGLAERDPAADVDGHDAVAKVMILSALVFGRQLGREEVACRGIAGIARSEFGGAPLRSGQRVKHVATLEFAEPGRAERSPPAWSPSSSAPATRSRTSRARRTRSFAAPIRSARSRSPGPVPDRSSRVSACSAT